MKDQYRYSISFKGLKEGVHIFNYKVGKAFFKSYTNTPIDDGVFDIELQLEKRERLLTLNLRMTGEVITNCDRCSEKFNLPLSGTYKVIVKIDSENDKSNNQHEQEVIYLPPGETKIDVTHFIYEICVLSFPIRKVHLDGEGDKPGCNEDNISLLQEYSISNTESVEDPRWDKLKNLKTV